MKKLCDAYSHIPERGNHVEVHVAIDIGDFAEVTVIKLIAWKGFIGK